MFIVTNRNDLIDNTEVSMTRAELIEMIIDGCWNNCWVKTVIDMDLAAGTAKDVTDAIAKEVWEYLDANNDEPHYEVEAWLIWHGHNCDHLRANDNPSMIRWPASCD